MKKLKIGLVLSGGGAIGAYQAGIVKAFAEEGIEIDVVSGASIGALNGSIIASSPTIKEASERLIAIWEELAKENPLEVNIPTAIKYALSAGLMFSHKGACLALAEKVANKFDLHIPLKEGILEDTKLVDMLNEYLNDEALLNGKPLYVSVYETEGLLETLFSTLLALTNLTENANSQFMHVQSLSEEDRKNAILASAALPLLYSSRKVNNKNYYDGGIGGWHKNQGNTPITPLIPLNCDTIFVSHLKDSSVWRKNDFGDINVFEIRPKDHIARSNGLFGGVKDLLGFSPDMIKSWIDQGYEETKELLNELNLVSNIFEESKLTFSAIEESTKTLDESKITLEESMKKIKEDNNKE